MREIGEAEVEGTGYQSVWTTLGSVDREAHPGSIAPVLVVRTQDGKIETMIRRNAKLPAVEASLQHLRSLGFKDAQLSQLFAHKGKGLAQHVKVLVSRLT